MTQPPTPPAGPKHIHTGGGAAIDGDAIVGRDLVNRDVIKGNQINLEIHLYTPAPPPQAVDLPPSDLHLLSFGRPLTPAQRSQIEQALGYRIGRTIHLPVEFEEEEGFGGQVVALLDRVPLTPDEWQALPILVHPPGFAPVAVCLLAEMHGRMGHFPAVVRLRPDPQRNPHVYVVAEIVNLQALRDAARRRSQRSQP